jgi:DNA-directed RNA polymerase specialized sigma subunit
MDNIEVGMNPNAARANNESPVSVTITKPLAQSMDNIEVCENPTSIRKEPTMTIKALKKQLTDLNASLYKNRQYLSLYEKQLACLYDATEATGQRTRKRMAQLEDVIRREIWRLEETTEALKRAIDAEADGRIQEVLTRRYISDETFEEIAEAMDYDLRWVYRLHARGVGGEKARDA